MVSGTFYANLECIQLGVRKYRTVYYSRFGKAIEIYRMEVECGNKSKLFVGRIRVGIEYTFYLGLVQYTTVTMGFALRSYYLLLYTHGNEKTLALAILIMFVPIPFIHLKHFYLYIIE